MRIRLTIDIERRQKADGAPSAPDVWEASTATTSLRDQVDYEPVHRVGFLRNEGEA